jgi:hypothetical protein
MVLKPVIFIASSRIKNTASLIKKIAIFTNQSIDVLKLRLAIPKCGIHIPKSEIVKLVFKIFRIMERLLLKKRLLEMCRELKVENEKNLLLAMEDAQQSANDYGQPRDRYDSYRAQLLRKRDMLGQQLEKVQNEIAVLDRIDLKRACTEAGFGSVVITAQQKVFISIGIGKICLEGEGDFYAISSGVPFAEAARNKKKGDFIVFNGKKTEVLDVF